jgi:hypothetical protein
MARWENTYGSVKPCEVRAVFGNRRMKEELAATARAAKQALATDSIEELDRVGQALLDAWSEAGMDLDSDAATVLRDLMRRTEQLKRRPYEQALRACTSCSGRTFRISDERTLEGFGQVRLVVCEDCLVTTMYWTNRSSLVISGLFGEPVAVPDPTSPFR